MPARTVDQSLRQRRAWKWVLIPSVAWLLVMLLMQWASNSRLAYQQRAARALKQATLSYVEPVPAQQQQEKLRLARQSFEEVAQQFRDTEAAAVARFYSIRISFRLREWEKAERDLDAFIARENDPDDYVIRAMEVRYQIYRAGGDLAKANDYFREVVEADLER